GSGLLAPDQIQPVSSVDLHTGSADYLVIAADSLLDAGQQLAALHQAEGLRGTVVPVSAIYDQFGTGAPHADAIAAFLTYAATQWASAPRYVALLGSASSDPLDHLGGGVPDLLPTDYVVTSVMGRSASDRSLQPAGNALPV